MWIFILRAWLNLRGTFYFQHNRKFPDSAGTLDKGKKRADAFEELHSVNLWQEFRDPGGQEHWKKETLSDTVEA